MHPGEPWFISIVFQQRALNTKNSCRIPIQILSRIQNIFVFSICLFVAVSVII